MGEFKSIREIAAQIVADYHRKYPNRPRLSDDDNKAIVAAVTGMNMPVPVVKAAMNMEALSRDDHDFMKRLGIRV
jgi:hypothetical protein